GVSRSDNLAAATARGASLLRSTPMNLPRPRRPTLLTVDDDLGVREAYALLFDKGMDVVGVESAANALVAARERRFDAILLDVRMPQMGGLEAFEASRAAQPEVP